MVQQKDATLVIVCQLLDSGNDLHVLLIGVFLGVAGSLALRPCVEDYQTRVMLLYPCFEHWKPYGVETWDIRRGVKVCRYCAVIVPEFTDSAFQSILRVFESGIQHLARLAVITEKFRTTRNGKSQLQRKPTLPAFRSASQHRKPLRKDIRDNPCRRFDIAPSEFKGGHCGDGNLRLLRFLLPLAAGLPLISKHLPHDLCAVPLFEVQPIVFFL